MEGEKLFTYIRSKGKLNADYSIKDIYNFYIDLLKNNSKKLPLGNTYKDTDFYLPSKTFAKICSDINEKILLRVIEHNDEIKLPYRLGSLSVRKYKTKVRLDNNGEVIKTTLPIDYKATKELWMKDVKAKEDRVKIYNLNEHFNGYRTKFHWEKKLCNFKNIKIYKLRIARNYRRHLAKCIKENKVDYYDCTRP
jgi:hypothetical protein